MFHNIEEEKTPIPTPGHETSNSLLSEFSAEPIVKKTTWRP